MMFVSPDNTGADNFECRLSDRTPSSLKHTEVRGEVAKQYPMNCEIPAPLRRNSTACWPIQTRKARLALKLVKSRLARGRHAQRQNYVAVLQTRGRSNSRLSSR
jgi:hypothetical protein